MSSSSDPDDVRLRVEVVTDESAARIILHGEADIANVDHLRAALDSIQLDGAKAVRLDVADLTFVDAATLRELTTFAHHMKQTGRTIETRGAGPMLQRMAVELDFHDELGLP